MNSPQKWKFWVALVLVGVCLLIDLFVVVSVWSALSIDAGEPAAVALTAGLLRVFYLMVRLTPTLAAVIWCIATPVPYRRTLIAVALISIVVTLGVTVLAELMYR
jgi:hypothetical protein